MKSSVAWRYGRSLVCRPALSGRSYELAPDELFQLPDDGEPGAAATSSLSMQVEHVEDEEEEEDEEADSPETEDALLDNVQRAREVCVTHCPSGNHRPRLDLTVPHYFLPLASLAFRPTSENWCTWWGHP